MKKHPPLTDQQIEDLWRPTPDFIGPVAPPMWLWVRGRGKGDYWLKPKWWLKEQQNFNK